MSAFMCDNQHFVLLVAGGLDYGLIADQAEAVRVGQMLADANGRSMLARYGHRDDLAEAETAPVFELTETTEGHIRPGWLLKAIACWDYQSCEYAEHSESEARAWCDQLAAAIRERHSDASDIGPQGGPTWDFTGRLADAVIPNGGASS